MKSISDDHKKWERFLTNQITVTCLEDKYQDFEFPGDWVT